MPRACKEHNNSTFGGTSNRPSQRPGRDPSTVAVWTPVRTRERAHQVTHSSAWRRHNACEPGMHVQLKWTVKLAARRTAHFARDGAAAKLSARLHRSVRGSARRCGHSESPTAMCDGHFVATTLEKGLFFVVLGRLGPRVGSNVHDRSRKLGDGPGAPHGASGGRPSSTGALLGGEACFPHTVCTECTRAPRALTCRTKLVQMPRAIRRAGDPGFCELG